MSTINFNDWPSSLPKPDYVFPPLAPAKAHHQELLGKVCVNCLASMDSPGHSIRILHSITIIACPKVPAESIRIYEKVWEKMHGIHEVMAAAIERMESTCLPVGGRDQRPIVERYQRADAHAIDRYTEEQRRDGAEVYEPPRMSDEERAAASVEWSRQLRAAVREREARDAETARVTHYWDPEGGELSW